MGFFAEEDHSPQHPCRPPTIRALAFGEGSWWATDVPAKSLFPINFLPSDLTLAPDFVVDCPLYRRDTCRFDCA